MTRLIGTVMAVALLVSVAPVMAGDSFHALSRLPAGLTPLDDAQLASVEGGQVEFDCVGCVNVAVANIIQLNIVVRLGDDGDIAQAATAAATLTQKTNN